MTVDEVRPFGDRLLVRPDPKLETSEGGLYIPETVRADNPNYYTMTGVVVALGDGVREDVYECNNRQCRMQWRRTATERCPVCGATMALAYADEGRHAFDVQVGDRVLFGRFAGKQVEVSYQSASKWPGTMSAEIYHQHTERLLIMRESEVLGVVETGVRVQPGYVPASWTAPKSWKEDPAMVRE